jgi:positive regulator of sigma E activity
MAVRRLRIVSLDGTRAVLEPEAACDGCGACAGRCTGVLSRLVEDGPVALDAARLPAGVRAGDRVLLVADEARLARLARRLYGASALGLLAGAVGAALAARSLELPADGATFIGALAGLAAAIFLARRPLRPDAAPPAFEFVPETPQTRP